MIFSLEDEIAKWKRGLLASGNLGEGEAEEIEDHLRSIVERRLDLGDTEEEAFLAASIDGAGPVRKFIYVTFPLMAPISIGAIIIRLIEASKIMDTIYVLTSGGPGTATETSSFYIFIKGLREFQMGYSAALSFTYLVIMIISLTIIAKVLVRVMIKQD